MIKTIASSPGQPNQNVPMTPQEIAERQAEEAAWLYAQKNPPPPEEIKTEEPISFDKDNTYDIGTSEDGRPREIHAGTVVSSPVINISKQSSPASNSPGDPGDMAYDEDYKYICVAPNSWKRQVLEDY